MQRARSGSTFEKIASYSRAARVGDLIAVSGTAALDEHGAALYPGDVAAQTREALVRALDAARELGAAPTDVIRTRILLVHGVEWRGAVEAHGELFRGIDPANTTLYVAGMIPEGCLVEVEIDAVIAAPTPITP